MFIGFTGFFGFRVLGLLGFREGLGFRVFRGFGGLRDLGL